LEVIAPLFLELDPGSGFTARYGGAGDSGGLKRIGIVAFFVMRNVVALFRVPLRIVAPHLAQNRLAHLRRAQPAAHTGKSAWLEHAMDLAECGGQILPEGIEPRLTTRSTDWSGRGIACTTPCMIFTLPESA
jgi:hypothetical protein